MSPRSDRAPSRTTVRRSLLLGGIALLTLGLATACDALGSFVVEAGDFAGAKADVHCDRRFVTEGGRPAAFCQEVLATVAGAEFSDDCRAKHKATAAKGPCPKENVIGGCKLHKDNADNSEVFDWYYDVTPLLAEAGIDPENGGVLFDSRVRDEQEVAETCADPKRYDEGAEVAKKP